MKRKSNNLRALLATLVLQARGGKVTRRQSYLKTKKGRTRAARYKLQQLTFLCVGKLIYYSPKRYNAKMIFSDTPENKNC